MHMISHVLPIKVIMCSWRGCFISHISIPILRQTEKKKWVCDCKWNWLLCVYVCSSLKSMVLFWGASSRTCTVLCLPADTNP